MISLLLVAALAADVNVETLMENSHWKRARVVAEAAYKANPSDAHANYLMARVRHESGNLDEAIKFAETAVKLDPKSSAYHRELGEASGEQAEKVSVFKQIGLARKIKPEFDTALALDPKNAANILDLIQYYTEAPGIVGGDKKKARQLADDEMKFDPSNAYLALIYIAQKAKDLGQIESLYQKAVDANPKNYDAQIAFAAFYLNGPATNYAKAELHARAANDAIPDRISAYRLLAYSLAAQAHLDDAMKVVSRAESAVPDDISPYVMVARALLRVNATADMPKAEGYVKKYIAETKEPERGAPNMGFCHWVLGLVYEKEGRKPEAIAELETASRMNPEFEAAKKDLKRLKG